MHIAEDGATVQHDASLCIGDLSCAEACPYDVPQWIEEEGVVGKCDFCVAYVAAGEVPACVGACPLRALEWGNIDELKAKYPDAVMDIPAIPDSSMTNPSVIINPRTAALDSDFQQKFI
jgi:anaerobic dimethyl sulfoxide reductase subunit B (iron-sulfur subunit)